MKKKSFYICGNKSQENWCAFVQTTKLINILLGLESRSLTLSVAHLEYEQKENLQAGLAGVGVGELGSMLWYKVYKYQHCENS